MKKTPDKSVTTAGVKVGSMNSIDDKPSKARKIGGSFLPARLAAPRVQHLPGDDRLDVETIIERIREAVRIGRADVACRLAEFAASIVSTRGTSQ